SSPVTAPSPSFSLGALPRADYSGPPIGANPSVVPDKVDSESYSWIGKAADWANTSFIDPEPIKRLTGWSPESGWGKGLLTGSEDLIRGLVTPLGIAFALGTMGTGSLFETAGMAALREGGLGIAEAADVAKGSQIITRTLKTGRSVEEAMQAVTDAGIDAKSVKNGLSKLAQAGLTPEALASKGMIHEVGSSMLRRIPGVSIARADNISTGINAMINLGFTAQNAYGAALASPRVFDALKEGDY